MTDPEPLGVRIHYDFASTLCCVAHRALARLAEPIAGLGIELRWTPLDLTKLVGTHRPGAPIEELRRSNAAPVAEELSGDVRQEVKLSRELLDYLTNVPVGLVVPVRRPARHHLRKWSIEITSW